MNSLLIAFRTGSPQPPSTPLGKTSVVYRQADHLVPPIAEEKLRGQEVAKHPFRKPESGASMRVHSVHWNELDQHESTNDQVEKRAHHRNQDKTPATIVNALRCQLSFDHAKINRLNSPIASVEPKWKQAMGGLRHKGLTSE
jgi:hypothetical protein